MEAQREDSKIIPDRGRPPRPPPPCSLALAKCGSLRFKSSLDDFTGQDTLRICELALRLAVTVGLCITQE